MPPTELFILTIPVKNISDDEIILKKLEQFF